MIQPAAATSTWRSALMVGRIAETGPMPQLTSR